MAEKDVTRQLNEFVNPDAGANSRPLVLGRLVAVERQRRRMMHREFADVGIKPPEFGILAMLRGSGQPCSPTQLFSSLMASSGGMTKMLDRLEAAGHVQRTPDPNDRRSVLIEITDSGRTLVGQMLTRMRELEDALLTDFTPDERSALARMLGRLSSAFRSHSEQWEAEHETS